MSREQYSFLQGCIPTPSLADPIPPRLLQFLRTENSVRDFSLTELIANY